ncbi:hypothetical protein [Pseudanabaena sp. BC1403]|uniref:hypothetical protein n=1 Tax=Pseudanabaena sp. BC1403 TaxID=2043171 RepID=UPI0011AFD29D|nr:hypothetical protein [Pseudanabaena sp. BC1403]
MPNLRYKVDTGQSLSFGQAIGARWYGADIFSDRGTTTIEVILYNQVIATLKNYDTSKFAAKP